MSRILGSNTVSVIATATNTVVKTIPVGSKPVGVAVTPDGTHAYVTNFGSNTVSVIATATNAVVKTIAVGSRPVGVAVTQDGTLAYVTNNRSHTVSAIATATNTVVGTIAVGAGPTGVGTIPPPIPPPPGVYAYVTCAPNTVSAINTATNKVVATAAVGGPWGRRHPRRETRLCHECCSDTVSVIATATNTVVKTIAVGACPLGVAVTPDGTHAYVTNASLRHCLGDRHSHEHGGENDRGGECPLGSPSPRTGSASMSRIETPTLCR